MKLPIIKTKILLLCLIFVFLPIGQSGIQKVEAQILGNVLGNVGNIVQDLLGIGGGGDTVRVVQNTSETAVRTALDGALARAFQAITSGELQSINLKETVLDPIAWNMAKQLQQQMTGNMLKWLGGQLPGQNGEVPFTQNYTENDQEILRNVMGRYLSENATGQNSGSCNPEHTFRVRTAVLNAYREDVQSAEVGTALSCQDPNSPNSNQTYSSLAHKIMGDFLECRDETCSFFAAREEGYRRALNAQEAEQEIRMHTRGMEAQRVCENVQGPGGLTQERCYLVNPPHVAAEAVTEQLVSAPSRQLAQIDEFNEIVSNFMNQLTNEAVLGISSLANNVDFTGVLGLSGNPDFTNLLFGPDGALSYVDTLLQDDVAQYQSGGTGSGSVPIVDSLGAEQTNLSLQNEILSKIAAVENQNDANKDDYGSCYDLSLTSDLQQAKQVTTEEKQRAEASVEILNQLKEEYDNASDATARNVAVSKYATYRNQGIFSTEQQNQELEQTIDHTLEILLRQFEYAMEAESSSCGSSTFKRPDEEHYAGIIGDSGVELSVVAERL